MNERKKSQQPATGASEAGAVVRLAQRRHHLAFDESAAMGALGAEPILVVPRAVVVAVFAKESSLSQRALANAALEAVDVEVLVLHPEHFTGALLLAGLTLRFPCKYLRRKKINIDYSQTSPPHGENLNTWHWYGTKI